MWAPGHLYLIRVESVHTTATFLMDGSTPGEATITQTMTHGDATVLRIFLLILCDILTQNNKKNNNSSLYCFIINIKKYIMKKIETYV